MSQFYIASEPDADRCRGSQISRTVITISGLNLKGKVQSFTGVVQSVDDDTKRHVHKRWRITMLDSNQATANFKIGR